MLIEKPTGTIRTAYDPNGDPYLFEATGTEAKRVIDILNAEEDGRLLVLPSPLPEGHGRLIDADEIVAEMEKKGTELDKIMELCKRVGDMENYFRCSNNQTEIVTFVRILKNAPTIVPAEGGTDECSEN